MSQKNKSNPIYKLSNPIYEREKSKFFYHIVYPLLSAFCIGMLHYLKFQSLLENWDKAYTEAEYNYLVNGWGDMFFVNMLAEKMSEDMNTYLNYWLIASLIATVVTACFHICTKEKNDGSVRAKNSNIMSFCFVIISIVAFVVTVIAKFIVADIFC